MREALLRLQGCDTLLTLRSVSAPLPDLRNGASSPLPKWIPPSDGLVACPESREALEPTMGSLDIAERPPINGLGAYPEMREAPNTRGFTYYFLLLRISYYLLLIAYYLKSL